MFCIPKFPFPFIDGGANSLMLFLGGDLESGLFPFVLGLGLRDSNIPSEDEDLVLAKTAFPLTFFLCLLLSDAILLA